MAYIRTVAPGEAEGKLKQIYDARAKAAGRVWHIVRLMSPNPDSLQASMRFYQQICLGPSPLSRAMREMIAVVVSRANHCHY